MLKDRTFGGPGTQDQSVKDMVNTLLTKLLGAFIPDETVARGFAGMLSSALLGDSIVGNATIFNQGTNTGLLFSQLGKAFDQMAQDAGESAKRNAQLETLLQIHRSIAPNATEAQHSAFADNILSNPIARAAYDFIDSALGFDHSTEVGSYIRRAADDQAINAFKNGQGVESLRIAREIVDNMLGDGRYDEAAFESRFGKGMTRRDVAILAAHIGNDVDFTDAFEDGYDAAKARAAGDRFASAIKNYGEALRPLKDVFGSDIPAMIDALEQLTGKAIGTMAPERVQNAARQLSNGVISGIINVPQLAASDARIRNELFGRPGLDLSRYMSHGSMAIAAETMVGGAPAPYFVDDSMYRSMVEALTSDPAMMAIADDYTKAFTIWQNGDAKRTYDQFIEAMGDHVTIENATQLALGPGATRFELDRAYGYESYYNNQMEGVGDVMAREERRRADQTSVMWKNARNKAVYANLGLTPGEDFHEVERLTRLMFDAMQEDSTLMNASSPDRTAALARIFAERAGVDLYGLSGDALNTALAPYMRDATLVDTLMTMDNNNPATKRSMLYVNAINAERSALATMREVQENRERLDNLDTALIDPSRGWAQGLTNGELWTERGIHQLLDASGIVKAKSPIYGAMLESALYAGQAQAAARATPAVRALLDSASDTQEERESKAAARDALQTMADAALAKNGKLGGMTDAERMSALIGMGGEFESNAAMLSDWIKYQNDVQRSMRRMVNYASSAEGMQNNAFMDLQKAHQKTTAELTGEIERQHKLESVNAALAELEASYNGDDTAWEDAEKEVEVLGIRGSKGDVTQRLREMQEELQNKALSPERLAELKEIDERQSLAMEAASRRGTEKLVARFLGEPRDAKTYEERQQELAEIVLMDKTRSGALENIDQEIRRVNELKTDTIDINGETVDRKQYLSELYKQRYMAAATPDQAEMLRSKVFEYAMEELAQAPDSGLTPEQREAAGALTEHIKTAAASRDGVADNLTRLQEYKDTIDEEIKKVKEAAGSTYSVNGVEYSKDDVLRLLEEKQAKLEEINRESQPMKEPRDLASVGEGIIKAIETGKTVFEDLVEVGRSFLQAFPVIREGS